MIDQQLETLLRDTFDGHARRVTSGPALRAVLDDAPAPARRRRLLPILAAAAAVVIALVATLVSQLVGSGPGHVTPSRKPIVRVACPVALPASWQQAIAHSVVDLGGSAVTVQAVLPSGQAVLSRTVGPKAELLLVGKDGVITRHFPLPDVDKEMVADAAAYGHWLSLTMSLPFSNAKPQVTSEIDVLDTTTGRRHTLAKAGPLDARRLSGLTGGAIADGKVYWATAAMPTGHQWAVESYDFATGRVSVVDRNASDGPGGGPSAVAWTSQGRDVERFDPLPSALLRAAGVNPADRIAMNDLRATLVTDGTSYAWRQNNNAMAWWTPGAAAPVVITNAGIGPSTSPIAVAGPYLLWQAANGRGGTDIADIRTGALTNTPASLVGASNGGVLAAGAWVRNPNASPTAFWRIDVAGLPALRC